METTYESRPAIQKYLSALAASLQATSGSAADEQVVEAGLADAREFLLSEWESLRESQSEPADDGALYAHFVAKFGAPEEVAVGYESAVDDPTSQTASRTDAPSAAGRPALRLAAMFLSAAVLLVCVAWGAAALVLAGRAPDGPQTVPPVEPSSPLGELRTSWAERVVSFRFGADEPRDPQAAAMALGPADCRRPDAEPPTCVSLGDGGELVVEFVSNMIVDGPGADLAVYEVGYFEPVRVAASENGRDWFELGVTEHRFATFDLAKTGLARARFVRATDARSGRINDLNSPGAEIDSIAALNSVAVLTSEAASSSTTAAK